MSNDKYLWDKTGEPDKDIQELEEILGPLRYTPTPLELPPDVHIVKRNYTYRALAIAASIALLVLGFGLWLALHNRRDMSVQNASTPGVKHVESVSPESPEKKDEAVVKEERTSNEQTLPAQQKQPRRSSNNSTVARNYKRHNGTPPAEMTTNQRAEAENAKHQLLLALRFASEKLNLAQKRAQGLPANQIRNQHKVG